MKLSNIRVGQRVAAYDNRGRFIGTVQAVYSDEILVSGEIFHHKALRLLVKKPRNEFWARKCESYTLNYGSFTMPHNMIAAIKLEPLCNGCKIMRVREVSQQRKEG